MTLIELARKLRFYIEKAAISLDDEDALEAKELFPRWDAESTYVVDDRVLYDEILYKCLQAHTAQASWTPPVSPSLWARVLIPDPHVIPEWEQPDSTNPYMKGDKVTYQGDTYESLVDNNVWPPTVASVWQKI